MYSLLIVFFAVSIGFSFLCSMWEAVLLSISPSYARIQQQEGTAMGRHLAHFKENIDRPLAAILTLNTIAHTVGAIGVGNQAAAIWADTNPVLTVFVVPVAMTLAILIFSEIIPKTIGATHWRRLVPFTVRSLLIIGWVLGPLVWLSQGITRWLKSSEQQSVLSRSDFLAMTDIVEAEGELEATESGIIRNLLQFSSVTARDVMTPRTVVFSAPEDTAIGAFHAANEPLRFSRIPLHAPGEPDHITGYVRKDDLFEALMDDEGGRAMAEFRRDIHTVSESHPIPDLFERFLDQREHIAVVIDVYGALAGIVTSEDVIETLLGMEIVDESDTSRDMQVLARRMWERRARKMGMAALGSEQDQQARTPRAGAPGTNARDDDPGGAAASDDQPSKDSPEKNNGAP